MRVGIYLGNLVPTAGGGYTFQKDIADAVRCAAGLSHEFVFLYRGYRDDAVEGNVRSICLNERYKENILGLSNGNKLTKVILRFYRLVSKLTRLFKLKLPVVENAPLLDQAAKEFGLDMIWCLSSEYEKTSLPVIVTVWDLAHRSIPWFPEVSITGWNWESREEHYRAILPRAAKVITGTEVGRKEILHYYGVHPENIEVIPFPAPSYVINGKLNRCTRVCEKYNLTKEYLFYPAQFWPHKNHVNVLYALKLLAQQGIKLEMVFTGSDKGNEAHVREVARELDLLDRVHFLGFVSEADIVGLYNNAFALLFASFMGPDNIPPLEAFALGCPVISSNYSGAKEQLGDAALLFDPKNPEDMSNAIRNLYGDSSLKQSLIEKGYAHAKSWSAAKYVNKVCRQIDDFEPIVRCWQFGYRHL